MFDRSHARVTAIKLSRHTGMDCRYPEHREVNLARPPWPLGSGSPRQNDGFFLNLMAVTLRHGNASYVAQRRQPLERSRLHSHGDRGNDLNQALHSRLVTVHGLVFGIHAEMTDFPVWLDLCITAIRGLEIV